MVRQEIPFLFYLEREQHLSVGMLISYNIWSPSVGIVASEEDTRRPDFPAVPCVLAHWARLPVRQYLQLLNEL